ncbi:MAG: CPBP family intramembrane metalloprotease [Bryobacterales bacterium]|nr:CPBP family intramembrane metalloprotease [Bryobacterales bacterium]
MNTPMRSFLAAVAAVWALGSLASFVYASQLGVPASIAIPTALAFLLELTFYLTTGFDAIRRRWRPLTLFASALAPFCLASLAGPALHWRQVALLAFATAAVCFWFERGRRAPWREFLLLFLMAAVMLAKPFRGIYADPFPGLRIDSLGQLMWFRIGLATFLGNGGPPLQLSFLPSARAFKIGALHFLAFMPVALLLNHFLQFTRLQPAPGFWWKAPATFLAFLFFVAFYEEVFFRGILQQRLMQWWGRWAGLLAASALFGFVHLWFRGFPNYNWVILTFFLGLACGRAFLHAGIGASIVAHALVVAAWRGFFA